MRFYPEALHHPKLLAVDPAARITLLEVWAYCHKYRTDGHLPPEKAATLDPGHLFDLAEAGLLDGTDDRTWKAHDYLDWQPSRKALEAFEATQKRLTTARQDAANKRWQSERADGAA